jgi:chorismate mutase/prephenate dehydratase
MNLADLRKKIDEIDKDLIELFGRRMAVSADIARYKKQHGLPVFDPAREREILDKLPPEPYIRELYALIVQLSRAEQEKI